jgi:hypothetical protein
MPRTQDDIDIDNLTPVVPSRLDPSQFEIVDSPIGRMERWRAASITAGMIGPLYDVVQIIRNDAAELQEKTVALDAKKHAVLSTVNRLLKFMSRVDSLTARMDALEAKLKADEEQQREFEAEPIPEPPGTVGPSVAADHNGSSHEPGGELHTVSPKDEPPSEVPEPPLDGEAVRDSLGDLPQELRDLPDPVEPAKGQVYPQPVAISLNKE